MGTQTVRDPAFINTGAASTDGATLTATNVPCQSVTGSPTFLSYNSRMWYRFNAGSGVQQSFRLAIPNATVQAARFPLNIAAGTLTAKRLLPVARYASGQLFRLAVNTSRQIEVQLGVSPFTVLGATTISGGLDAGDYEISLFYDISTTSTGGSLTLKVVPITTENAVTGGTISLSGVNLGGASGTQTHWDVGSNDTAAQAIDLRIGIVRTEDGRTTHLPSPYSAAFAGSGSLTGTGTLTATNGTAFAGTGQLSGTGTLNGSGTGMQIPTGNYDILLGVIQSNMRSRADDGDATLDAFRPGVYMWDSRASGSSNVQPATEPMYVPEATPYFPGPLNRISRRYIDEGRLAPGRNVLLVNVAWGGTGFATPDSNGGSKSWLPSTTDDGTNATNNLYAYAIRELQQVFAAVGTGSRIVGIFANHGSSDGSQNTPKATFKQWLYDFIDRIRSDLFTNGWTATSTVAYNMMQMRPSLLAENRHLIIDQAQQELAAEKTNVRYAYSPTDSSYARADSVHFNAAGEREVGSRLYDAWTLTTAALTGTGTLTATSSPAVVGMAGLAGVGTLTSSAQPATATTNSLTGTGTLTSTATPAATAAAALTGAGTLNTTSASTAAGNGSLGGNGQLTSTGVPRPGSASALNGQGSLTAGAIPVLTSVAALTGAGALSASSGSAASSTASLTGVGQLAATASSVTAQFAVALAGTGTLTATSGATPSVGVALGGVGNLTTTSATTASGSATLTGLGNLASTNLPRVWATAELGGLGALTASANPTATTTAAGLLTGVGLLTAVGESGAPPRQITLTGTLLPRRYTGSLA